MTNPRWLTIELTPIHSTHL